MLHNLPQVKSSVNCVLWLRDGRRCITGASSGEFEVWDGKSFTMETILQAHENCVRSLAMSHSEHLIISSDDNGRIKVKECEQDIQHCVETNVTQSNMKKVERRHQTASETLIHIAFGWQIRLGGQTVI